MRRKKILYLTRPLAGGMLKHLQSLMTRFAGRWDVCLAAPDFSFPQELREKVRFFPLHLMDGLHARRDLEAFGRLMLICREERPDIIHVHGYRAAMVGLPAARLCRRPSLVTVHNFLAYPAKSLLPDRFFPRVVKLLDPAAAGYIAVSEALRRELAGFGIPASKIVTVYNGIDPGAFVRKVDRDAHGTDRRERKELAPLSGWNGVRVGTAGRLVTEKGFDLFIRAAASVAEKAPEAGFFIAGEGPERKRLEYLRDSLGLRKRVFLLGEVKSMPYFLSSLDLFVLASRSEGLSISLLEAGAAGLPRIASATGGIPEIIAHGKSGLLFPPGDAGRLSREMLGLIRQPQQRAALGREAAAETLKHFTDKRMLQETEKVYESILERSFHYSYEAN